MGARQRLAGTQLLDRCEHILGGAAHPFELDVLEPLRLQPFSDRAVTEERPVITVGRLVDLQHVLELRLPVRLLDADVHVLRRLADLKTPRVLLNVRRRPCVDPKPGVGAFGKKLVNRSGHRLHPSAGSSTRCRRLHHL